MNQLEYQREVAAFDEKIALAELEETKAKQRKDEIKYQKSRFLLDFLNATIRAQVQQQEKPAQPETEKDAG